MIKQKSIQSTLFRTYFYILITVMLTLMIFFNISEAKKIKSNAFMLLDQNVNTISSYIDDEAKTLNTVAQNIAYSNLIKKRFLNYIDSEKQSNIFDQDIAYDNLQNTKVLIDMLIAILGPNQPVVQIYLYSLDKGVFGVGLDTSTSKISVKDAFWYEPLLASEQSKFMACELDERLERFYSYKGGATFI
ncbi:MAG TPA: sensor histidine kinase, partial [Clostridiales bacterium]|nr:sensor histidine kinase [Clostridiales bacterium]